MIQWTWDSFIVYILVLPKTIILLDKSHPLREVLTSMQFCNIAKQYSDLIEHSFFIKRLLT